MNICPKHNISYIADCGLCGAAEDARVRGLPSFEDVNARLAILIEAQKNPTGCQAVYYPNDDGGASYIIQIAFRGGVQRQADAAKFLEDAHAIVRDGGREMLFRAEGIVGTEKDFETNEIITKGYSRLHALDRIGPIHLPLTGSDRVIEFADMKPAS